MVVAAGAFNALGKPLTGLPCHLLRTAVLYAPPAWAASRVAESWATFAAIAAANALAGALDAAHALRWLARADQGDCRPVAAGSDRGPAAVAH